MPTNIITNAVANVCQICGGANGFLHSFKHLAIQECFWGILIIVAIIVIFMAVFKYGAPVNIETWFGKLKIPSMKKNGNTVNMCELCIINVTSLVANIAELYHRLYKLEQRNINEQIRELDSQFFLENSWINNCHGEMIKEKMRFKTNLTESEMTKIVMKNEQILYFIWMIKRQEMYEFVKNIILINNFCDKNLIELEYFAQEKGEILAAAISGGVNLYPEWDDKELLFKRQEYSNILMERVEPRIQDTILHILQRCQVIQKKFNEERKSVEKERDTIIDNFKKALPPRKKQDN